MRYHYYRIGAYALEHYIKRICNDLYILFTAGYRIVYPVIPKIHGFTYNNRFIWSFLQ